MTATTPGHKMAAPAASSDENVNPTKKKRKEEKVDMIFTSKGDLTGTGQVTQTIYLRVVFFFFRAKVTYQSAVCVIFMIFT